MDQVPVQVGVVELIWRIAEGKARAAGTLGLQLRLGRDLQPDDFGDVPCNTYLSELETPRLLALLLPQARFVTRDEKSPEIRGAVLGED